jgi:hypothetical protein
MTKKILGPRRSCTSAHRSQNTPSGSAWRNPQYARGVAGQRRCANPCSILFASVFEILVLSLLRKCNETHENVEKKKKKAHKGYAKSVHDLCRATQISPSHMAELLLVESLLELETCILLSVHNRESTSKLRSTEFRRRKQWHNILK